MRQVVENSRHPLLHYEHTNEDAMSDELTSLTLNPCQSLALRRLIDTLKADDGIFSACPDPVRSALADIIMPPYTTAEDHIRALIEAGESGLRLIEKFGARIRELERKGR